MKTDSAVRGRLPARPEPLERAGLREPERPRDVGDAVGDPGTGDRGDREREAERERICRCMPCRKRQPTGNRGPEGKRERARRGRPDLVFVVGWLVRASRQQHDRHRIL